jgi:hypothetical protein
MACEPSPLCAPTDVKEELSTQGLRLGNLLRDYDTDKPSTLTGKFKGNAFEGPNRLRMAHQESANAVLASNYYDVYPGRRN